jgi:hypothetical protein
MADIEKKTKRYPTDLTDEEWSQIEPLLPKPAKTGRRRTVDLREVVNAIRYLARSGCGWRRIFRPGRRSTGGSGALCDGCCFTPSTMWP